MSENERPITSTRDRADLRERLERWLRGRHPAGERVEVPPFEALGTNGMSSETLLFRATWPGGDERLVARLSPDPDAVPVFPTYDIEKQYRIMQLVGERSAVPVPTMRWYEGDASHLGAPFLVMDRLDGQVPPDMMPYVFGSWVTEATDDERRRMQSTTVKAIADLHSIPLDASTDFLHYAVPGDTALRRHVADQRSYYDWVVVQGVRSPLIERAFGWLDANWPDEPPPAISWGDSRIGNVLYADFAPVAVLDWEMVGIAPREVDLGWLCYMHRFFQRSAEQYGMAGLPGFLLPGDVAREYREFTGYTPRDLDWYVTYACVRFAIISFRIARRSAHFGEAAWPDDPDDALYMRADLEAMLA